VKRCELLSGIWGRSPSRNRTWCIIASKHRQQFQLFSRESTGQICCNLNNKGKSEQKWLLKLLNNRATLVQKCSRILSEKSQFLHFDLCRFHLPPHLESATIVRGVRGIQSCCYSINVRLSENIAHETTRPSGVSRL